MAKYIYYLFTKKQFKQWVQKQFTVLGYLPVLLALGQVAQGQRFIQLWADNAFVQAGIGAEFGARRGFQ